MNIALNANPSPLHLDAVVPKPRRAPLRLSLLALALVLSSPSCAADSAALSAPPLLKIRGEQLGVPIPVELDVEVFKPLSYTANRTFGGSPLLVFLHGFCLPDRDQQKYEFTAVRANAGGGTVPREQTLSQVGLRRDGLTCLTWSPDMLSPQLYPSKVPSHPPCRVFTTTGEALHNCATSSILCVCPSYVTSPLNCPGGRVCDGPSLQAAHRQGGLSLRHPRGSSLHAQMRAMQHGRGQSKRCRGGTSSTNTTNKYCVCLFLALFSFSLFPPFFSFLSVRD